jgi:hypothetical protein
MNHAPLVSTGDAASVPRDDAAGLVPSTLLPLHGGGAALAGGRAQHPPGSGSVSRGATSFEFYRALRFEDEFEICIRVAAMDASTMRYRCELSHGGERVARGDLTISCVSKRPNEPMRTIPIPADIAARFRPAPEGAA